MAPLVNICFALPIFSTAYRHSFGGTVAQFFTVLNNMDESDRSVILYQLTVIINMMIYKHGNPLNETTFVVSPHDGPHRPSRTNNVAKDTVTLFNDQQAIMLTYFIVYFMQPWNVWRGHSAG